MGPINTHGYLNTHGYPRGYRAGTYIIFIQQGGDMYHTIRTHEYPLTSLLQSPPPSQLQQLQKNFHNFLHNWKV